MSKTAILGACTAYGIARKYGYTGTEEEWNALQNSLKEEAKTYATNSAESATAASTSEKNAATSEANAKTYMDSAEAYKNSAFSATPEGYESNMQKLADMDIQTATGESLCISDTCAGGIKLNSIKGKSVQDGEPTPDAPVEIESVGDNGSIKITSCGKNLSTVTAIDIVETKNNNYAFTRIIISKKLKPNTKYTVSLYTSFNAIQLQIMDSACEKTMPNSQYRNTNLTSSHVVYTFTTPNSDLDDYTYIVLYAGAAGATAGNEVHYTEIQIEEGEYTTFEPYQSTEITIPLSEPLRSIGDIKDEIVMQDGRWGVERRITHKSFAKSNFRNVDGRYYDTSFSSYVKDIPINGINSGQDVQLSTMDIHHVNPDINVNPDAETIPYSWIYSINGTTTLCRISNYLYNNMGDNTIEINYVLKNSSFEPFTDQTPFYGLSSFDGVTNIITDQTIEPTMELEYGKSMVGAYTLENHNTSKKNEAVLTDLQTAYLTTLAQEV